MPFELSDDIKRELAGSLFNLTWTYLNAANRTADDDDRMIDAAHASSYFWSLVGKPENMARAQWQISRAYAVLKRAGPALYHARRSLTHCEADEIWGFDRPFAYEALARAYAVAGDVSETERYLQLARELGEAIENQRDRDYLFEDLSTIVVAEPEAES